MSGSSTSAFGVDHGGEVSKAFKMPSLSSLKPPMNAMKPKIAGATTFGGQKAKAGFNAMKQNKPMVGSFAAGGAAGGVLGTLNSSRHTKSPQVP